MHYYSFLSIEFFSTLIAPKLFEIAVRLQMISVMGLRIHRKSANVALIPFYTKMNYVEVIYQMRFIFETKKKKFL